MYFGGFFLARGFPSVFLCVFFSHVDLCPMLIPTLLVLFPLVFCCFWSLILHVVRVGLCLDIDFS